MEQQYKQKSLACQTEGRSTGTLLSPANGSQSREAFSLRRDSPRTVLQRRTFHIVAPVVEDVGDIHVEYAVSFHSTETSDPETATEKLLHKYLLLCTLPLADRVLQVL